MEIRYTKQADKDIKILAREVQKRIMEKTKFFASAREPSKFAKRLTEDLEGDFAFRVGDWRIKFVISKNIIVVHRIKHRSHAY